MSPVVVVDDVSPVVRTGDVDRIRYRGYGIAGVPKTQYSVLFVCCVGDVHRESQVVPRVPIFIERTMIKKIHNVYINKRKNLFNQEEKHTLYPFLKKINYLQREETNVFTNYIRYSIELLNHIIIKGATYKQYNVNTNFFRLKKPIVLGVVKYLLLLTAAVAHRWRVRLACWISGYDPRQRQTRVVKAGSDSSTAIRAATGVCVTGPRRCQLKMVGPCHSRCVAHVWRV